MQLVLIPQLNLRLSGTSVAVDVIIYSVEIPDIAARNKSVSEDFE